MISVDISKVPLDKQKRPDFLSLKTQMESALAQQQWINAFCVHEAGHMIYLTQIGVTQYAYLGPRIEYDEEKDRFDGYMAAVKPETGAMPKNITPAEYLTTAAKAHAAGGTFSKRLTGAPDHGDQEDRENLDRICVVIEKSFPGFTIDRESSWKQAQQDVLKDLRSPAFRAEAWEKAREIQKRLFGS